MSTSRANDGTGESIRTMLLVGAAPSSLSGVSCSDSATDRTGSRSTSVSSGVAGGVSEGFSDGLAKSSSSSTTGGGWAARAASATRAASCAARAAVPATRGPHRFLCRAGSFGGSFRLDRSICIGLLLREPLSFGDLPCLAGGARRLFGRALRLLRDASGLRSAICLRGALRLESATRFLLGGARFILCDPRLLLRGLCLRRRCVRFARRVRDRARLTADVFDELGDYI